MHINLYIFDILREGWRGVDKHIMINTCCMFLKSTFAASKVFVTGYRKCALVGDSSGPRFKGT